MEKIKINKLDQRGTMLIVGIEGKEDHTMQTGWQAQEVDYFMKDVGEGGTVLCTLYDNYDKNNTSKVYHNIKDVDFSSAVKGDIPMGTTLDASQVKFDKPTNDRECSIVAQVILKGAVELAKKCDGQELCELVNELTGAYKLALSNVKAL